MSTGWIRNFLISPERICRAMPPARPGMLENARADHGQQIIGDHVLVGVAADRRLAAQGRVSKTAPHRKICVTIGRNRISVPSAKSPR